MNKKGIKIAAASALVAIAAVFMSAAKGDDAITKEGTTTVVNTQKLGAKVRGFKGQTPVKIYIKKNKIVKVEALGNRETPKYFAKAKTILSQYEGMPVKKAVKAEVDGVTGATFSCKALKENVKLGLEYYQKNK